MVRNLDTPEQREAWRFFVPQEVIDEYAALAAADALATRPAPAPIEPQQATMTRRSREAAEAAIAEATGVSVDLSAPQEPRDWPDEYKAPRK